MVTTSERFEQERVNVGDGWQPIVDQCHAKLTELLGEYDLLQIKEKFGGLRYYFAIAGAPLTKMDEARTIVDTAETLSFETCEICGEPGYPDAPGGRGWIKTYCDQHHDERRQAQEQNQV